VALRVVGAGLGRTGTHSLKLALEQLLGAPCYHMFEVMDNPDHIAVWDAALRGDPPDWNRFLSKYAATVDWPACAFWRELADANPDALVLLSVRDTADWWTSAHNTIFGVMARDAPPDDTLRRQRSMAHTMLEVRFTPNWRDEAAAKAAYEHKNDEVRASVPPHRLLEWRPGDGWEPICLALGLPVPSEPFPHVNTTADFRAMLGIEAP